MQNLDLRDTNVVMNLERLGSMHQSRISFTRTLVRKMAQEHWSLRNSLWDLDKDGYGVAIYEVKTPNSLYNLVIFANFIEDDERNDRVIASKWDVTFTFIKGDVDERILEVLRANVPLQEAGRNFNKAFVLARANKSVRVFDHIVNSLAQGKQPNLEEIAKVGYILRTTAVYGSGKFGISDFAYLQNNSDFSQSFSAEMCAVYIIRQFSLDWVNYIAKNKSDKAVSLKKDIARYLGVGNATGLGMAPYLIKHPKVVDNWLYQRELAISRVSKQAIQDNKTKELCGYLNRASEHFKDVITIDERQNKLNNKASSELLEIIKEIKSLAQSKATYKDIILNIQKYSLEAQEATISSILELYPSLVDEYEKHMSVDESLLELTEVSIKDLKNIIETKYKWALDIDFNKAENNYWFWYVSEEKEEPRLGIRDIDEGASLEQPLDIARQVNKLYEKIKNEDDKLHISLFLLKNPAFSQISRRVWTLGHCNMGEIRANVLAKDFLPMHLLRAKLAIFGATKFDPRSDRWVQVTFFQSAPLMDEIHPNEWLFPLVPKEDADSYENTQKDLYVSANELKAACIKAYNALTLGLGEADLIASMVIDLQMVGLDGVGHFSRVLGYLKNDKISKIDIIEKDNDIKVDLKNQSTLFHIQIIIAYAINCLKNQNQINLEIKNTNNRLFVYSQLKRLASKNLYANAFWSNSKNDTLNLFSINKNDDFPNIYMKNNREFSNDKTLHIQISKQPLTNIKCEESDIYKSSSDLSSNYEQSAKKGIKVSIGDWDKILEFAKKVQVRSSEKSRNDAGGVVE